MNIFWFLLTRSTTIWVSYLNSFSMIILFYQHTFNLNVSFVFFSVVIRLWYFQINASLAAVVIVVVLIMKCIWKLIRKRTHSFDFEKYRQVVAAPLFHFSSSLECSKFSQFKYRKTIFFILLFMLWFYFGVTTIYFLLLVNSLVEQIKRLIFSWLKK